MIKNTTIIVSGASQGLGKELSIRLAGLGAKVALVSRNEQLLSVVKKEINEKGGEAEVFACDITVLDQVKNTVNKVLEKFGGIDILVNDAGIWANNEFEDMRPELIENIFKVNTIGHIYFIKSVLPLMKKVNKGHIFNVISRAGLDLEENKDWATYAASKWAMNGYTQALRHSLVSTKIKISAIFPGGFESNILENLGIKKELAHNLSGMMKTTDVVDAIVYALDKPDNLSIDSIVINPVL